MLPVGGGGYYINDEVMAGNEVLEEIQKRRGQSRSPDTGNDEDSANVTLSIRPPTARALDAMRDVTRRFYNKKCEVSGLIDSALGADPSNFKKVSIFKLFT